MNINLLNMQFVQQRLMGLSLAEMSLMGTVLILFILLLRILTKKYLPQMVYMILWYAAVIRFLLPLSLPSRFSLYGLQEYLFEKAGGTGTGYAASQEIPKQIWQDKQIVAEVHGFTEEIMDPVTAGIIPVLKIIWLAGFLLIVLYFLLTYIRCRRKFRESLPLNNNRMTEFMKKMHMFRHVEVRSLDRIDSPLTYGIFRPVILLPGNLGVGRTDENVLLCILSHECIHIRRLDTGLKFLLAAVLAVHWFNPFVWVMYVFANRDIELSCDEAVIRRLGDAGRAVYASALLYMEERRCEYPAMYNCFSRNALEERITVIMKKKKISVRKTAAAAIFSILAVFAVFAGKAEAENRDAVPDIPQQLTENEVRTTEYTESEDTKERSEPGGTNEEYVQPEEAGTGQKFIWVAADCDRITSAFGTRVHPITGQTINNDHITIAGMESAKMKDSPIYAAADGIVSETGFSFDEGNYVRLDHGNGLCTMYTHCETILVETGDNVIQGDTIATLGKTGRATGVCLGFYVYQDGVAQDPVEYLPVRMKYDE